MELTDYFNERERDAYDSRQAMACSHSSSPIIIRQVMFSSKLEALLNFAKAVGAAELVGGTRSLTEEEQKRLENLGREYKEHEESVYDTYKSLIPLDNST